MEPRKPLQIMFLGTGSDVGKSVITGAFCRLLARRGYRVAPFKAQNMALNSFVTMDGGEMGRAQVFQAAAAGVLPDADMNPVLLKPSGTGGEATLQVIVHGKVYANCSAGRYYEMKRELLAKALESYGRLTRVCDAIVLEGAGSAVELNLKEGDFVNMPFARITGSPVIIVGDIDRGGIFAQIVGSMRLLPAAEKRLVAGFIVNKFRGDPSLFSGGAGLIEKMTRRPVFGVIPFFERLHLPEEDSVALGSGRKGSARGGPVIAVVRLPHISNYTDFDPFEVEEGVTLRYAGTPAEVEGSAAIILPGTKNVIEDLGWLKARGFIGPIRAHVAAGKTLVGICGGYQMLGRSVADPSGVESDRGRTTGLGFLRVDTVLGREKTLTRVRAVPLLGPAWGKGASSRVEGYEIHMGRTAPSSGGGVSRTTGVRPAFRHPPSFRIIEENGRPALHDDGAVSGDGVVWGTYLHGLFENDDFRRAFLGRIGRRKRAPRLLYRPFLEAQYDRLADLVAENTDVDGIIRAAERFRRERNFRVAESIRSIMNRRGARCSRQ
jgi:adenosylcobyric acid synthase